MGEVKLTNPQREALNFILANGPGTLPLTKQGRTPAAVVQLVERKLRVAPQVEGTDPGRNPESSTEMEARKNR